MFLWFRASTMIANEIGAIRRREIRALFATDFPLPLFPSFSRWILNSRGNRCRRYTPVESKLNVELSRFTSASSSRRAAGRRCRPLLLGARVVFSTSRINLECKFAPEPRGGRRTIDAGRRGGKINQDIKRSRRDDDVNVAGYLNQCYLVESLAEPARNKSDHRPDKVEWGKCDGFGAAEVPDKQISPGKTDNYPPVVEMVYLHIRAPIFTMAPRAAGI